MLLGDHGVACLDDGGEDVFTGVDLSLEVGVVRLHNLHRAHVVHRTLGQHLRLQGGRPLLQVTSLKGKRHIFTLACSQHIWQQVATNLKDAGL